MPVDIGVFAFFDGVSLRRKACIREETAPYMAKSVKKNYLYNLSYQILVLLAPLVTTPYVSRVLGADGIGTYSFAFSIVTYFTLFAGMGTAPFGQREVSFRQDDRAARTQLFWNTWLLSCAAVICCTLVYLAFIATQESERLIYAIMLLNILAVAFDITWLFQGMEEFGRIVARNAVFKLLTIAGIFLLVRTHDDLAIYTLVLSAGTFLSAISLWGYLRQLVDWPDWHSLRPWRYLPVVLSMFIPTVAISIYTVLNKTMIGLFSPDFAQNGYFEQAMKISSLSMTIITSMVTVMIPRIGHYMQLGDKEQIQRSMYESYRFVWLLGVPLCCGLIGIAGNLVPWFFGWDFLPVIPLLMLSSLLIPTIALSNVTGLQYLVPTCRQSWLTYTVLAGAGVNVVLNLLLIPTFYAAGAMVASVAAEMAITAAQFWAVRRELSIPHILAQVRYYLPAGLIMLAILLPAGTCLTAGPLQTTLLILLGTSIYFTILYLRHDTYMQRGVALLQGKLRQVLHRE